MNPIKNQSSDPAKQRAGFYIKYNTGLKWVKGIYELFASLKSCSTVSPLANHKPVISVPKALKNLTSLHRETNPPDNYNMLHMLSNNTYTYQNVGKLNINWLSRQNSSRSIFETEPWKSYLTLQKPFLTRNIASKSPSPWQIYVARTL